MQPPLPLLAFFLGLDPVPVDVAGLRSGGEVARAALAALALPEKLGRAVTSADVRIFVISRKEVLRLATGAAGVEFEVKKGAPLSALDTFDAAKICEGGSLLIELMKNDSTVLVYRGPSRATLPPSSNRTAALSPSPNALHNVQPYSSAATVPSLLPSAGHSRFPQHLGLSGSQWMSPKDVESIELEFEAEQASSIAPAEAGLWVKDWGGTHRPSSPLVTGDGFRVSADVRCVSGETCSFDAAAWAEAHSGLAVVIYSRQDGVKSFLSLALPRIRSAQLHFVFVTQNSDYNAPNDNNEAALLEEPLLLAWFGINPGRKHPKLHLLPYGFMNRYTPPVGDHPETIIAFRRLAAATLPTRHVLSSFSTETNVGVRVPLVAAVEKAFGSRSTRFFAKSVEEWYAAVLDHKMVISLTGHGLDTHRTWEILTLGRVPVVESSLLDPLYEGLPVLILNSWSDLARPDEIDRRYAQIAAGIAAGKYSSNRVWLTYYICEIFNAARRGNEHGCPPKTDHAVASFNVAIPQPSPDGLDSTNPYGAAHLIADDPALLQLTPARLVALEAKLPSTGPLGKPGRAPHVVVSAYDEDLEWVYDIAATGWDTTVFHKHPVRAEALRAEITLCVARQQKLRSLTLRIGETKQRHISVLLLTILRFFRKLLLFCTARH